jgi:hypothetical protein
MCRMKSGRAFGLFWICSNDNRLFDISCPFPLPSPGSVL